MGWSIRERSAVEAAVADDADQLLDGILEAIVDDDVGELGLRLQLGVGGLQTTIDLLRSVGAAARGRQLPPRSASREGGAMNTCTASGIFSRIWRAP